VYGNAALNINSGGGQSFSCGSLFKEIKQENHFLIKKTCLSYERLAMDVELPFKEGFLLFPNIIGILKKV
jgi:hypothetical protein